MRRNVYRPQINDRLEDRVVLSRPSTVRIAVETMRPAALKIGALGDSLTDEYRFTADRRGAKNFIEILAATRHLRFGAYSAARRAEPRNAGYANNWARVGATSDDMVRDQLPGLANQVRRNQVNLVSIFIGANDFLRYAQSISPFSPPSLEQVSSDLAKIEQRAEENLTTAIRTLMAANANLKITLVTLPDLRQLPAAVSLSANPQIKPLIDAAGAAIGTFNAKLNAFAAQDPAHIAIVDLSAQYAKLAESAATTGKITLGGQTIDTRTPGNDPSHLFLGDGVHLGTVGQGLFANLFIQTVDTRFNVNIRPLRPAEILRQAKLR